MRIEVTLDRGEYVEDWTAFREAFEEAAKKLDLSISQIVHRKDPT